MNFVVLIKIIAETIKLFILAKEIFGMTIKKHNKLGVLWVGYIIIICYSSYNITGYMVEIISDILFFILVFDESFLKKIESFILSYLLVAYLDVFILEIYWLTEGRETSEANIFEQIWFNNIMGIFIWIFIVFLLRKKKGSIQNYFSKINFGEYLRLLILTIMVILTSAANMMYSFVEVTRKGAVILSIFNLVIAVIIIFIITHMLKISYKNKILEEEKRIETELLKIQQDYYEKMLEKDEGIRRFRHDLNAHMRVLNMLFETNSYEELGNYIRQISEKYSQNMYINTNNKIADCFINELVDNYRDKDFEYNVVGKFPDNIGISDSDFCIIIANVIKNVWDALEKYKGHKELFISIRCYKEKLFTNIINSSVNKKQDILATDKRNKKEHGIGTKQIINIVDKYNGIVEWKFENEKFHTKVVFEQRLEQNFHT